MCWLEAQSSCWYLLIEDWDSWASYILQGLVIDANFPEGIKNIKSFDCDCNFDSTLR